MSKTYVQPVLHKATTEWLRLYVAPHLKDQFAIEKLAKKASKPKWEVEEQDHSGVKKKIADAFETDLRKAFQETNKKKRSTAISEIDAKCKEMFAEDDSVTENQAMAQLKSIEKDIVRTAILNIIISTTM